jgi:hypothetical protein
MTAHVTLQLYYAPVLSLPSIFSWIQQRVERCGTSEYTHFSNSANTAVITPHKVTNYFNEVNDGGYQIFG